MCNKQDLSQEEAARYQSIYCGLCKVLGRTFGEVSRISLNYDMTFLIIFLSSLYEPEEREENFRCSAHPLHKKNAIVNQYTDYAADIAVAFFYYKCLDDWKDEHKHLQHKWAEQLFGRYREVKKRYPRQCDKIEIGIAKLDKIENSPTSFPDEAVNCFGEIMAEVFVVQEDFWSASLRKFGYNLGRFIYLMDAAIDYKKDYKSGNYNPIALMGKIPEEMEEILSVTIGEAMSEFEKLPLIQDVNLMKSILYGGVWQKYYARKGRLHD